MRWVSTFRSGAFRLALGFAAVFALGSIVLLVAVEKSVASYALEATAGSIDNEIGILRHDFERGGRSGLIEAVGEHARSGAERDFHYLVIDPRGQRLTGDLPASTTLSGPGEVAFRDGDAASRDGDVASRDGEVAADEPDDVHTLKSFGVRLSDGTALVVATDTYDVQELRRRLDLFAIWCGAGITLLALGAGYLIARLFLHRLERVNTAVETVIAGNFAERLPAIGMGPEFDQLSRNLNRMLDRIGGLVEGLRQVSTDIAHDLRTPLTRLRQQLEGARGATSPAAHQVGIDSAIEQTDTILGIFGALLRIGTIEGGTGRSRFAPVDLSEIVERLYLVYQPAAEDGGRSLSAAIEPGLFIDGDAELLAQLFANLIENALAHTPRGTRIVVQLIASGSAAIATVADNGPGVPEIERRHVLTRFYRLDASRHVAGAGLGLALAAAVAALHDAAIRLGDNAPGLVVELTFPTVLAPADRDV